MKKLKCKDLLGICIGNDRMLYLISYDQEKMTNNCIIEFNSEICYACNLLVV
jgi:hypothetical protein